MAVIQFALAAAVILLAYALLKYRQNYWRRRGIVHIKPSLLKGSLEEWPQKRQISQIFQQTYEQFRGQAPFAGFNFFMSSTPIIMDLDLIKNILIKDFHNFESRGIFHNEQDDPLTGNLFFLDGEKWRKLRHKMSPTFTSGKMKQMFGTVVEIGHELTQVFGEKCGAQSSVMEITDLLARFTADVIGTCAFGLECNSLRQPKAEFVEMGKSFITTPRHNKMIDAMINTFPEMARKMRMRVINEKVHQFYMRIVRETVAYREEHNIKRNDFMDMLIEMKNSKEGLSIEEIAAQAFVFFIAGYETSSTTMGFVLIELAKHTQAQEKAREEVNAVLKKYDGKFVYEAMKDMQYLDQVIDETLRLHPVVAHLVRRAHKRYETSDPKYFIEAGQMLFIPTLGIHYDPDIYEQPEEFRPERFAPEALAERHLCAYLPFGEGPRNCIGLRFGKMQSSIGLALLLKHFKFSIASETEDPPIINTETLILGTKNGIRLRVEKIQ